MSGGWPASGHSTSTKESISWLHKVSGGPAWALLHRCTSCTCIVQQCLSAIVPAHQLLPPPLPWVFLCLRWVRSIAFDPSNEWFVTGSADRTIKLWDTASGQLKLTLTGHIEQVTGLAVSPRHPYMFSCSLDKEVKCWDLEHNKVMTAPPAGCWYP